MRKPEARQVAKLTRFRRMAEDCASLSLQRASREAGDASQARRRAVQRMDEISGWKASMDDRGDMVLSLYEHALALEQDAATAADLAADAERAAGEARRQADEKYRDAFNATRVAKRRGELLRQADTYREERGDSDAAADMWLTRTRHADV